MGMREWDKAVGMEGGNKEVWRWGTDEECG